MIFPEPPKSKREVVLEQVFAPTRIEWPWLQQRTILLTLSGYRAYGTNPTNDRLDVRGVCVPTLEHYFGIKGMGFEAAKIDDPLKLEVIKLQQFLMMATNTDPDVLDILFADDDLVIMSSSAGQLLRENRDLFISKQLRWTLPDRAEQFLTELRMNGLDRDNYDYRHADAARLVRWLSMGLEIVRDGAVIVRRPDAAELNEVESGKWNYYYLEEWAEAKLLEIIAAYETSPVPALVDIETIEKLSVEITKELTA